MCLSALPLLLASIVRLISVEDWTNIMSYDQPIPCLPFSCLVTPAVWFSRPPLLCSRDAGPRRLSLLIWLLALRRAWGQSMSPWLCVCKKYRSSVRICADSDSRCMHRDGGSQGVGVWMRMCALCHYVGGWPIWLTVSDNDLSLG